MPVFVSIGIAFLFHSCLLEVHGGARSVERPFFTEWIYSQDATLLRSLLRKPLSFKNSIHEMLRTSNVNQRRIPIPLQQ